MAHEIRTPLNGIMGILQLLQMTELSEEQAEYIQISLTSSNSLLQVLNDILDYSKLEAGKLHFEMLRFNIRRFIKDIELLFKPSAMNKGLTLETYIDACVPDNLLGDSFRLRQILTNLVGNAIKFTYEGRIDLVVRVVQEAMSDKVKLMFAIKDTGIGIPQDKIEEIFESFTQVDISNTRKYGGSGLGLSICKKLVGIMEGEIWVERNNGKGSIFYFTGIFDRVE